MTQYALAHLSKPIVGLVIPCPEYDGFFAKIARELFPAVSSDGIYVIDVNGMSIDDLMLDAQKLLIMQTSFDETDLSKVIRRLFPVVDELVFWYGSEYDDLDEVSGLTGVLRGLEDAASISTCEAYIRYRKMI